MADLMLQHLVLQQKKNEARASLVRYVDRSYFTPSLPGRLPLCAGEALMRYRARARPPPTLPIREAGGYPGGGLSV